MKDQTYLDLARSISKQGRCKRRQIGAVIVDPAGVILSNGHNGPPRCMESCYEKPCPGADVPAGQGNAECYGVHAEILALLNVDDRSRIHTIYSTKAPCTSCVLTLLETSCKRIVFSIASNETTNKKLWESAGRSWG